MTMTSEERLKRAAEDRRAAAELLQMPGGEKLIRHLATSWLKNDHSIAANHGQAGWALAMFQAVADLRRLREEGP